MPRTVRRGESTTAVQSDEAVLAYADIFAQIYLPIQASKAFSKRINIIQILG